MSEPLEVLASGEPRTWQVYCCNRDDCNYTRAPTYRIAPWCPAHRTPMALMVLKADRPQNAPTSEDDGDA